MPVVLILHAMRYSLYDERTKSMKAATNVMYIQADMLDSDGDSGGVMPIKNACEVSLFEQLTEVPGWYDVSFYSKVVRDKGGNAQNVNVIGTARCLDAFPLKAISDNVTESIALPATRPAAPAAPAAPSSSPAPVPPAAGRAGDK